MYVNGEGGPEDDKETVRWYRLAAEQDYVHAQYNLGLMYANGESVPENTVQAYAWLNLSITAGHENAKKVRQSLKRG